MPEQRDALEAPVGEVVEVGLQDARRTHHLVDAGDRGERGHVHRQLLLELDRDLEQDAVPRAGVGYQHRHLPEVRFLLARRRAQRGAVDLILALGEQAQAAAVEDRARIRLDLVEVGLAGDEHVGDGERRIECQLGGVAAAADLVLPDRARDVDQHAASVALAVHVAGPVEHLLQRHEALLEHVVGRLAVPANGCVQRARVLVLHGLRRPERLVGLRGRVSARLRRSARVAPVLFAATR